jgi:hypothetical protein
LRVVLGPGLGIQSGSETFHPELRPLLCFVVHSNIDSIEIDNFLKTYGNNIRSILSILAPVSTNPFIKTFLLSFGIDVPSTNKAKGLEKKLSQSL